MASYSTRDMGLIPPLTLSSVENYIKLHKKPSGSESIDKGFEYFRENYIHSLSVRIQDTTPVVTGKCFHSQKKNDTPSQMSVQFASIDDPEIVLAWCNCPIGLAGACGHIVGLLYQLATYKKLNAKAIPVDITKAHQPQTWHEQRGQRIHGKAVEDLSVSGQSASELSRSIETTLYNPIRGPSVNWKDNIRHLESAVPGMLIIPALKQLDNVEMVSCKFGQVPKGCVLSYQQKIEENCINNVVDETTFPEL